MKTYKMSHEQVIKARTSKTLQTLGVFVVLFVLNILFGIFIYYRVNFFFYLSILLLLIGIYTIIDTGTNHFELKDNRLSHFKRGTLKNSFDLKQVRVVASMGQDESTLVIKHDGNIVVKYHSEILGIAIFNELLKDISAINNGTYQS